MRKLTQLRVEGGWTCGAVEASHNCKTAVHRDKNQIRSPEAAAGVMLLLVVFSARYHVTLSHRCLLKSISFGDTVSEL